MAPRGRVAQKTGRMRYQLYFIRLFSCANSIECKAGSYPAGAAIAKSRHGGFEMLHWSLIFLVIAIIAGILGFTGIAGAAMGIAKFLFFLFLVIWLIVFFVVRKAV
jgi:uncharacterized membrane protein YtjA (UPF0391 family)